MTGSERVRRAIEFGTPDRVPLLYAVTRVARERHGKAVAEIQQRFPCDFGNCGVKMLDIDRTYPGTQADKWGCVWRNEIPGLVGMVVDHPLSDWGRRRDYRTPEPDELVDASGIAAAVEANAGDKYLMATGQWLWQRMFWVRGFENILIDIAEEREELVWLRDRVLAVQKGVLERVLPFEIDAIWFLDDWGSQTGLLIRPEAWRTLFRDAYADLFSLVHSAGKKVIFHTDGNVSEIVPDLIEIGADVLNLQAPVVDSAVLAERAAGRVCLLGGMDLQGLLAQDDPEAVAEHARDLLTRFAGANGGYIGQVIMDESTLPQNARAAAEAIAAFRP